MPCNVLQPPSTLPLPPVLPSSSLPFPPRCHSPGPPPPALPPPRFSLPSNSLPSWRCSIEIQFPPTHPSHLPTSNLLPPPPSLHLLQNPLLTGRETLSTRERKPPAAFRAINYVAQLFTGISRRHCLSDYQHRLSAAAIPPGAM